jgi:hypothetical protein
MADVVEALRRLNEEAQKRREEDETYTNQPVPQKPWKNDTDPLTDSEDPKPNDQQSPSDTQAEDPPPPAPRTFSLLLKISQLTQHYLTTSSPTLRTSLLSLLGTTIPALAQHENSFLPLINTLWPVLLPRLQDPEAYVVSNALEIMALMCTHAGDFMRSRIEGAWDVLKGVQKLTKHRSEHRSTNHSRGFNRIPTSLPTGMKAIETGLNTISLTTSSSANQYRPELYVDAPSRMIWNSLVKLFCAVAQYVAIRDEHFDDMLRMLDPVLEKEEVKRAMETCNADAVWLRLYKKGDAAQAGNVGKTKMLVGRAHWRFVEM